MALKSQALPMLMAAALCLATMRGLALVGSSTLSGGDGSASEPLVSGMSIAKFMTVYMGVQFLSTYFFTGQAMKGYFKEGSLGEHGKLVADYLLKCIAQNMFPLLLWSAMTVASGTVSKEYVAMLAVHFFFVGFDIVRMSTTCEAIGISKSVCYPYILLCVVMAYLSYTASLAFVGSSTTSGGEPEGSGSELFVSAMGIAKFMTVYMGFQFLSTYFFTEQAVKGYFKEGFLGKQEQKLAVYLMKAAAQNMFPLFLWSTMTVASGTVSKEYMLMLTMYFPFAVCDIVRMTTTCEPVGIEKSMLYPYILLCAVMAYLSYAAWQTMGSPRSASLFLGIRGY